ncbi:4-methylaminobutanoate oxidase (formaldehyde-forming) [Nymphon striatum]|nr:4-methylaminobutanoate oxidase (formaldehyde-forming) [Nymphon striatum]
MAFRSKRTENMSEFPTTARVVIIGGGVVGTSTLYHLAKAGWTDCVLLEKNELTAGSTWHAAGNCPSFSTSWALRATQNMTKLAKYSQELYGNLESETGVATGFKRCGSITVALTEERREEIYRQAAMARAFGVEVEEISPDEVKARYEHLNIDGIKGAVYLDKDGQGDPANIALALAKGARNRGAIVQERCKATGADGSRGHIESEMVVNCGGMWGHEVGRMLNTNAIPGLTQMPVLRVPDECAYYKEDAGKMLLGAFEPNAKPWAMDGIPNDFEFDQLPEDFDHFEPILEAGIHTFFNGPESFTPDDAYHLGLAPEMDNVWVAAGFNSVGIQSAGGAGMALAQWMDEGQKPFDLGDVDISRMQPFQGNKTYLFERSKETLGLLYADHYPFRQKATAAWCQAHAIPSTPAKSWRCHGRTGRMGACKLVRQFRSKRQNTNTLGVARTFSTTSQQNTTRYGPMWACMTCRHLGKSALSYTQFLNERAGIEADVTVTRLSETAYLVVTPAATRLADETWMRRHVGDFNVVITDVTAGEGCSGGYGAKRTQTTAKSIASRFQSIRPIRLAPAQDIEIGMAMARVHRVTYVGELGWEVYVSADMAGHVFETLHDAGQDMDLKLCGMHMMDTCRIEKGFRHFGHDITAEDHVMEAGLGFAVKKDKDSFIGRDAVLKKQESGLDMRMVQFKLTDPEPLLYHAEPILRDGEIVGYLSSGAYGHTLGGAIGMGYVPCKGESVADILASSYEIDVAGVRVKADASLKPMYDPKSERVKV